MKKVNFKDLYPKYDVFLFDSFGVIKNSQGIIDGVPKVLQNLRKEHKKRYRIITNDASSGQQHLSDKFAKGGIHIRPHRIISSGLMAQQFLTTKSISGSVLYLGTERSSSFIDEANKPKISVNDYTEDRIDEVGCIVFLDDEGYDLHLSCNKVVNILRKKHIPVIVANSDLIYPTSKNEVAIATGSIAKLVEHILGRNFIHFGKPDTQIFNFVYEDLKAEDQELSKSQILMIGDTLHTDIIGGIKFGIDTCLVMSGNTQKEEMEVAIKSSGIVPDYYADSIVGDL